MDGNEERPAVAPGAGSPQEEGREAVPGAGSPQEEGREAASEAGSPQEEGREAASEAGSPQHAPGGGHGFWRHLRRYFFTGLVVLLPAVISGFVLWRLFTGLDLILGRYVEQYVGYRIPGVGLVALLLIIIGIGALASNILGKRLIRAGELLVERIPILRWIYRTMKQLFSMLLQEKKTTFGKVVLVNFPDKGTYSMAFQTSEGSTMIDEKLGRRMVAVFLPTTPNPTSGYFLLVPEDEVIPLDISADEGLKYIISAGAMVGNGSGEDAD